VKLDQSPSEAGHAKSGQAKNRPAKESGPTDAIEPQKGTTTTDKKQTIRHTKLPSAASKNTDLKSRKNININ